MECIIQYEYIPKAYSKDMNLITGFSHGYGYSIIKAVDFLIGLLFIQIDIQYI